ncbi:MAG: hypothetical protein JW720_03495 [Sedimentisphaerales bacterium]|nr:hypothetical protein [Sedimentisphaerales bacterium]
MPFTPYHFGPSGFVALALRKWIDIPVFVLANVVVDVEVLVIGFANLGYPFHRYCHTLLIGAALGAAWGLLAYALRRPLKSSMTLLRIKYKPVLAKMIVSGILGVWLHVLIDSLYHYDVSAFWPYSTNIRRLTHYINRGQIKTFCLAFALPAAVLYVFAVIAFIKTGKQNKLLQGEK